MSRYLINCLTVDDDGTFNIQYLDKQDALRREGGLFKALSVSVTSSAGEPYRDLTELLEALYDVLGDITEAYRDEAPFVPGEQEDEDEDDLGMGF